jgi:hypothetical protein
MADVQVPTGNGNRVVKHVLHERIVLLGTTLDGIQWWDDICQSSSTRATTGCQYAEFVVAASQTQTRKRVQSVCQITGVVTEDSNVLGSFEGQSIVDVFEQDNSCCTKFADQLLVVASNVDAALRIVSEVVQVL